MGEKDLEYASPDSNAACLPDGRLVDARTTFIDLLGAGEGVVRAGLLARAVD